MLRAGDKTNSLIQCLSYQAKFFRHKAELKLRLLFDLLTYAYPTYIYIYNIQISTPPYILRATLSKSNCPFVGITIQIVGKNNLD
jgi:hypothetical protein